MHIVIDIHPTQRIELLLAHSPIAA
jgi:hypothetical protein